MRVLHFGEFIHSFSEVLERNKLFTFHHNGCYRTLLIDGGNKRKIPCGTILLEVGVELLTFEIPNGK